MQYHFDIKQLNHAWTKGPGWIDNVLFKDWLQNHFIKHAVASRPLLLLLDGHALIMNWRH